MTTIVQRNPLGKSPKPSDSELKEDLIEYLYREHNEAADHPNDLKYVQSLQRLVRDESSGKEKFYIHIALTIVLGIAVHWAYGLFAVAVILLISHSEKLEKLKELNRKILRLEYELRSKDV